MNFINFILQDYKYNKQNTKGRIACLFFRAANILAHHKFLKILCTPYLIFYKILFEWIIGMEIPYETSIGEGLKISHLQAIVINRKSVIGKVCQLRQCTTIGNSKTGGKCPVIGNNVNIGSNVCIIGSITIGDNVIIGAGSVVVKDVASNSVIAGNPAKVINSYSENF